MAGILTSNLEENETPNQIPLYVEKCLSEFNDGQKAVARDNLNVYDKESVYTQDEVNEQVETAADEIRNFLQEGYLSIIEEAAERIVNEAVKDYITSEEQRNQFFQAAKKYSDLQLKRHTEKIGISDPHLILPVIEDKLEQYVKQTAVNSIKNELNDKINQLSSSSIKRDGTTSFTKPQGGVDPQKDNDLTTRKYVNNLLKKHLIDVDPHGFLSILNHRLASYAKTANTYDKTQTYSRVQVDSIVKSLVNEAFKDAILDHLNEFDPHNILSEVRKERYIKQDGSIPFRSPQKGVDATDPQDLVTLHQVEEKISNVQEAIDNVPEPIWITSGPVQSTVGHVDDNTEVPEVMTLQEIMDAIFYGTGISLEIPDFVVITESCPITMCVRGGLIQYAELYQDGELIYTFQKEDFENGCITVDSKPIFKDSEFTFKVYYPNGSSHEETKIVNCYMPVFVGLLPKWKFGNTVTMDYLIELCKEDSEGTQNRFVNQGKNLTSFTFKYEFKDPNLRHIFIALPKDYPDLDTMVTKSQSFNKEAFDVIDMIPFKIPGVEEDVIFKLYIYRQALSSLNQDVTFNFEQ